MNHEQIIDHLLSYAEEGKATLSPGSWDSHAVALIRDQCSTHSHRMFYVNYYLKTKHAMQDDYLGFSHVESVKESNRLKNW
jgi:hypothetical protein